MDRSLRLGSRKRRQTGKPCPCACSIGCDSYGMSRLLKGEMEIKAIKQKSRGSGIAIAQSFKLLTHRIIQATAQEAAAAGLGRSLPTTHLLFR